jgi:hypothetical protein
VTNSLQKNLVAHQKMQNGENITAPLFDTIGHGAEQVDSLDNDDEQGQKLVEEIESMCINCEENVRSPHPKIWVTET